MFALASAAAAAAALCFLALLGAAHRLWLHPLAKYPGPVLSKLTDWHNVAHCWKGDRHVHLYRLHQQYGPVVRFGPNRISFCTPGCLQPVYGMRANTRKADWYRIWEQLFGAPSTATILDHKTHARRKRILQNAFSDQAIRDMEEFVLGNTRTLCGLLAARSPQPTTSQHAWSDAVNVSELTGFLTFDIMGDMVFSKSFRMQSADGNRAFVGLSLDALRGLNTVGFMPLLLKLNLPRLFFRDLDAGMQRYKLYCADESTKRTARQHETKTRDVWSELLAASDPLTGEGFTDDDLRSEAAILISAASHPMRITLGGLAHYLLRNARCMAAVCHEVRSKFASVEDVRSGPALQSCHYLRACITETLRLSPGIPGIPMRTALDGGICVDGQHFPAGTDVGVSTYALQHRAECFPDPFAFAPERWMLADEAPPGADVSGCATKESLAKAKAGFCAFSLGPMGCLGKNVVYHQVTIIMARLLWLFDLKAATASAGSKRMGGAEAWALHGEFPLNDKFSAEGDGPWVHVRPRMSAPNDDL